MDDNIKKKQWENVWIIIKFASYMEQKHTNKKVLVKQNLDSMATFSLREALVILKEFHDDIVNLV